MKNLSKKQLNRGIVSQMNDKIKEKSKLDANEMVTPEDILFSLKPLLDEYFVGAISFDGKKLIYETGHGQTFRLLVQKITRN